MKAAKIGEVTLRCGLCQSIHAAALDAAHRDDQVLFDKLCFVATRDGWKFTGVYTLCPKCNK